jgi:hypothetical protein
MTLFEKADTCDGIDGLVTLTSAMLRRDFRAEGRNLEQLGLAGKSVTEIRSIVETGSAF